MKAPPFTITNDSITVIWDGVARVVQKGTSNFENLRKTLAAEDWESIPKHITIAKSLNAWAKGKFTVTNGHFCFEGKPVPEQIDKRMVSMASRGESPEPMFKFWERLQKNPSFRSVNQLWGFLSQMGIPITEDGYILAYKSVKDNYKDHHTGTFDNSPGRINEMPRNKISDDPEVACDEGFHVGALNYARTVMPNGRIVVCKVDPADVVCVPKDHSMMKVRVCKYEVIGNNNGSLLPSTTFLDNAHEAEGKTVDIEDDEDIDERCDECDQSNESHADSCSMNPDNVVEGEKPKKPAKKKAKPKNPDKVKLAPKNYSSLNKLDYQKLMEKDLDTLRKYAAGGLKIVGASKIPGGKVALVSQICKVRGDSVPEED